MKVDQIVRRPTEYLNDSGLPKLVAGVGWVFLGISQLIWPILARRHPDTAPIVPWAGVGLTGLAVLAFWWLKQRVVFPRSGYVVPRQPPSNRIVHFLAFAGVLIVWFLFRGRHQAFDLRHFSAAPYFAFLFAFMAAWEKTRVGYLFAGYLVCLGATLLYLRPDMLVGMCWLQIGIGGPMAVYGAIRLRQFLKANPAPVEGE